MTGKLKINTMKRDLREYSKQTTVRLIVAGLLLLFMVGGGLIFLIYGQSAGFSSLICLAVGMIPIGMIFLALWIIDWIVKRSHDQS
jgi:hypothetical protein